MLKRDTLVNQNMERDSFHQETGRHRNRLDKCGFIHRLKTLICTNFSPIEYKKLDASYERFLSRIKQMTESETAPIEILRQYDRTTNVLHWLLTKNPNHTSECYFYIRSSIAALKFERKAVLLQIEYPGIKTLRVSKQSSPFRLSDKYTPTDLIEILTVLHDLEFFCLLDNAPAPYKSLVHHFEQLCGVKIKDPDNARWAVLNRKTKLTHFVDMMRNTLIDLSRR